MRRDLLRTTQFSLWEKSHVLSTELAVRQGENGERSASFSIVLYHTCARLSRGFQKKNSNIFFVCSFALLNLAFSTFFTNTFFQKCEDNDTTCDIFPNPLSFLPNSMGNFGFFSILYRFARKIRQKIVYFEYCLF